MQKSCCWVRAEQGFAIDSLQGTMQVDTDGHVTSRSIQLVYTVTQQEQSETFLMTSDVKFHQLGEIVEVALPDLSGYKAQSADKPAETLTPLARTVYVAAMSMSGRPEISEQQF